MADDLIGIHDGMSAKDYHAVRACSNSACKVILNQSPAHLMHQWRNPRPPTPDLILGSAAHTMILEPAEFDKRYAIAEPCAAVKRDGNGCGNPGIYVVAGEWRCGTHSKAGERITEAGELEIITADQYAACQGMRDSVLAHPVVGQHFKTLKRAEVSAIWRDPPTGVLCKARWDAPIVEAGVMLDLKTSADAGTRAFQYAAADYGYANQAAFYLDGAHELDVTFGTFAFVVVEKVPPYACRVFEASEAFIEWGRREVRRGVEIYAECERTGVWPGYEDDVIDPPSYVNRKFLQEQV